MNYKLSVIDIKGNTGTLDPRSKIIIILFLILGSAIALDYFQIFLYTILYIPVVMVFKPRLVFIKRLILPVVFITILSAFLYLGIQTDQINLSVLGYSRTYSKVDFILLIAYRYLIIIMYNYMLLHSEDSYTDIIEALASFKLGKTMISILLLIKRISTRVTNDYARMYLAARSKGAFSHNIINFRGVLKNQYIKLLIVGRTIVRSISHSRVISKSLTARGFHDQFQPTIRPWSSEGITIAVLSFILFVNITIIPWVRL